MLYSFFCELKYWVSSTMDMNSVTCLSSQMVFIFFKFFVFKICLIGLTSISSQTHHTASINAHSYRIVTSVTYTFSMSDSKYLEVLWAFCWCQTVVAMTAQSWGHYQVTWEQIKLWHLYVCQSWLAGHLILSRKGTGGGCNRVDSSSRLLLICIPSCPSCY